MNAQTLINQTEKKKEKIRQKVLHRQAVWDSRSEKWQESEAGCNYEYVTKHWDETADSLEYAIGALEEVRDNQ
jgi:hypothetical protein